MVPNKKKVTRPMRQKRVSLKIWRKPACGVLLGAMLGALTPGGLLRTPIRMAAALSSTIGATATKIVRQPRAWLSQASGVEANRPPKRAYASHKAGDRGHAIAGKPLPIYLDRAHQHAGQAHADQRPPQRRAARTTVTA